VLFLHLLLGSASAILICTAWWIHYRGRTENRAPAAYRWPIQIVGVLLVSLTGHLGGFLSGVNGAA